MPGAIEYDKNLLARLETSADPFTGVPETVKEKKHNKKQTDLLVAGNPNNPYPVYQTLLKSDNFSPVSENGRLMRYLN